MKITRGEQIPFIDKGVLLGAGGVVALAWEIGILAGLHAAGITPWQDGEVIGSSAGAFAGAAVLDFRGIDWAYDRQVSCDIHEIATKLPPELVEKLVTIIREFASTPDEAGKQLGVLALEATTMDAGQRLEVVRDRLRTDDWPGDRLAFTVIDAVSGQLELLDRASNVDIVTAAAASCAIPGVWPVVAAGGRQWIDGGSVSPSNAQLAGRYENCLVVAPLAIEYTGQSVSAVLASLTSTRSALIVPNEASLQAFGSDPLDASRRPAAARAGFDQGRREADRVAAVLRL